MHLKKYSTEDFDVLESWITDAGLLFQFAGTAWKFPFTRQQMSDYQIRFPERQFYMAYNEDSKPFAFGEIIVDDANTPRLGRLLIGQENSRGKGLGVKFIDLLIQECNQRLSPDIIYLYVFEDNLPAIRCYEKAGFLTDGENKIVFLHHGIEHVALVMKYTAKLSI